MKKSTKVVLITSACLIFGGLLIAIVSGTVGGTKQFKELADKQELSFQLPYDNSQLRLNTSGLYFTSEDEVSEDEVSEDEVSDDVVCNTFSTDETVIENVELKLGAGEVELKKSTDGTFHVGEGENMHVSSDLKKGTLTIKTGTEKEVQIFGFSTGTTELAGNAVLYLPDQAYEKISIEMGAGVCKGEIPECAKLTIDLGAGEIELDYANANEVEMNVGAGECKIGLLEADKLEADIAMGEFKAKTKIGTELDATVGMGEIEMEIIGQEDDFDYDVEVGAGEVQIGSRSYSGVGSGGSKDNDLEREINIECGMGEATLKFVQE